MISFNFKKLIFCATLVSLVLGNNLLCSNDSLEDAIVDDAQRKNLNVVQNIKNSRFAQWVEQNPRISFSGTLNAAQAAIVLVLGICVLRTKSKTSKANVEAAKANGDRDLVVAATATATRLAGEATAATALINEKLGRLGAAGVALPESLTHAGPDATRAEALATLIPSGDTPPSSPVKGSKAFPTPVRVLLPDVSTGRGQESSDVANTPAGNLMAAMDLIKKTAENARMRATVVRQRANNAPNADNLDVLAKEAEDRAARFEGLLMLRTRLQAFVAATGVPASTAQRTTV